MAPLRFLTALISLFLCGAVAQSDDSSGPPQKVWAVVSFINHGETTPQLRPFEVILTPEGAQQLFRQGAAFRDRYLSGNSKNPTPDTAPISNISQGAINNAQITALSLANAYTVGGATAFFQGLYPSNDGVYNNDAGGMDTARNLPAGNNLTDYPLGGYQYAQVQTFSSLDIQHPTLQGTSGCTAWDAEVAKLSSTTGMEQSYKGSYQFYQNLFKAGPLAGLIDPTDAEYWKAYDIYELVKYMYTHNSTVFRQLEDVNNTLALLEANALELETAISSPPSDNSNDATDIILTVGGRTLADRIEYQLMANGQSSGENSKLTVMFGSHLPMMSFFHLANLKSQGNSTSDPFSKLPRPGSAMVFELVGNNQAGITAMPAIEDLRVRFLYRDSADVDAKFHTAALFNSNGADQGLPWTDFSRLMRGAGLTPFAWCDICQPADAAWCQAAAGGSGDGGSSKDPMGPVLAGAIGAVVTLAVTSLLGLALFLICGFRLHRSGKDASRSSAGGFKGAERMPDDKDVAIDKGGAHRERVGSWELRDGPESPPAFNGAGIVTSHFHRRDEDVEDDGISITGARVVNTRESV